MTGPQMHDPSRPGPLLAVAMPGRVRALPRNRAGYPIPWFASTTPDGGRDLRVASTPRWWACVRERLCWICGQRRSRRDAFVVGPTAVVNRTTSEPPCHIDCAEYAAKACPYLTRPDMVRRPNGIPEGAGLPGVAVLSNPGVTAVYVTTKWELFHPPDGAATDWLIRLGDPLSVSWWTQGRTATHPEAYDAMRAALPTLHELCDTDPDPDRSHRILTAQWRRAVRLLPDTTYASGDDL